LRPGTGRGSKPSATSARDWSRGASPRDLGRGISRGEQALRDFGQGLVAGSKPARSRPRNFARGASPLRLRLRIGRGEHAEHARKGRGIGEVPAGTPSQRPKLPPLALSAGSEKLELRYPSPVISTPAWQFHVACESARR